MKQNFCKTYECLTDDVASWEGRVKYIFLNCKNASDNHLKQDWAAESDIEKGTVLRIKNYPCETLNVCEYKGKSDELDWATYLDEVRDVRRQCERVSVKPLWSEPGSGDRKRIVRWEEDYEW